MNTTKAKKAVLPVNKPFIQHGFKRGEDAIAASSIFRERKLRLYAGVPVSDLESVNDPTPWAPCCEQDRIDYLVCKGPHVIMTIEVTDRDQRLGPPVRVENLFFAETDTYSMAEGEVDGITEQLENLLQGDFLPAWQCGLQEFDDEWMDQLIEARLMDFQSNRAVVPTEYGAYEGLVTAIAPDDWRSTVYSLRIWEHLSEMFHSKGDIWSMRFVHQMENMPLEEYTEAFPQMLHKLEHGLPRPCRTYGEAAEVLYNMLQDGCELIHARGTELLQTLALPLFNSAMADDSGYDAPQKEAIYQMEPTLQAAPYIAVYDFFRGVALLTGLHYPDWLARTLLSFYSLDTEYPYTELLCTAYERSTSAAPNQAEGTRLLYQLLIEPFHLIHQKNERMRSMFR